MPLTLTIALSCPTAVAVSPNVLRVAAMFGLGIDASRERVVVPPLDVPIAGGSVVFITGPSGGGKSTILRLIAGELARRGVAHTRFDEMPEAPDRPLVDCLAEPGDRDLRDALAALSLAGLSDAFVMLRRPGELSDGQRYRFRLARVFHEAMRRDAVPSSPDGGGVARVVLADEFGATLDRVTAQTLARNVRRWTRAPDGRRVCFIAATTHDDLLEAFDPDALIVKDLGESAAVLTRERRAEARGSPGMASPA